MTRRVLLVINREKAEAASTTAAIRTLLAGHTIVGEIDALQPLPADVPDDIDLAIVLGGDGTLLAHARHFGPKGVPLLGVNIGRLGFMAEFDLDAFRVHAPQLLEQPRLNCRDFSALHVRVVSSTGESFSSLAINDAVITAGPPYRMISVALSIDGGDGPTVNGDGLIIASPVGSTAYNLSAGGPIIAPEVDALTITAIAPHTLSFRPIVTPGSSTITVTVLRANASRAKGGTTLVLDGQVEHPIVEGDRIVVTRRQKAVRFVANPAGSYWRTLLEKLRWAATPRLGHVSPV
ncbi:MAG: NAD(+)/NADH kinase [Planctomycetota bacterium]|nr:NAD(+)/NADH kinase [Planctomycetota bacterium]